MKKVVFIFALVLGFNLATKANGSKYHIDEQKIDKVFSQSQEMSYEANGLSALALPVTKMQAGDQTKGGYLLRAFFCSFIALHRSYMGTGGKSLWWFYLCVPVVGGFDGCVDFWWVVFSSDALDKYRDNSKFFVWAD